MLLIQGPFPTNQTAVVLPSPSLGNNEGIKSSVQTIRMMDGSLRTYVKVRGGRKAFRWEFEVGHIKAKEVEDYLIANSGSLAQVTWNNNVYIGYLTLNPLDMEGEVAEFYRIILEFEEKN